MVCIAEKSGIARAGGRTQLGTREDSRDEQASFSHIIPNGHMLTLFSVRLDPRRTLGEGQLCVGCIMIHLISVFRSSGYF